MCRSLPTALSVGDALGRPATVKCRIGVDDEDSYEGDTAGQW